MKLKKHLLSTILIILFIVGGVFFLFYHTKLSTFANKGSLTSAEDTKVETLRKKYPHLQPSPPGTIERLIKKPTITWKEWIDTNVKLSIARILYNRWNDGIPSEVYINGFDTPEKLAKLEEKYRKFFTGTAEFWRKKGWGVPVTAEARPVEEAIERENNPPGVVQSPRYEGPQVPQAITEEFDETYNRFSGGSDAKAKGIDDKYPRSEWIQTFLDKGARFEEFLDYEVYLGARHVLEQRAKTPEIWASGKYGIQPSSTFEEYKNAFIDREIWLHETLKHVKAENPEVTGMIVEGDTYLPTKPNLTYVRRNGPATTLWGTPLSDKDKENLIRHGIHPKGIEIVYIDENYNLLSEKPAPYDPGSPDAQAIKTKILNE